MLQETNIVLWKSRGRYRPGSNFLAWAFTIARLEVLHYRTRTKRQRTTSLSDELLELLSQESSEPTNYEAYLQALEGCKAKLPENQRELIDLRYQSGYSLDPRSGTSALLWPRPSHPR